MRWSNKSAVLLWGLISLFPGTLVYGLQGMGSKPPAPPPEEIQRLEDGDPHEREHAIEAVIKGASKFMGTMIQELRTRQSGLYMDSVAQVLAGSGSKGVAQLKKMLRSKEPVMRQVGVMGIGYLRAKGARYITLLVKVLTRDKEKGLRIIAAMALTSIAKEGGPKVAKVVSRYLCAAIKREKDKDVQSGIMDAIMRIGYPSDEVLELLENRLENEEPFERGRIARMICEFELTEKVLTLLEKALMDPDPEVWNPIMESLRVKGPKAKAALPILFVFLTNTDKSFDALVAINLITELEFSSAEEAQAWWDKKQAEAEKNE